MSATTHHHFDPLEIENLENQATKLLRLIEQKYYQLLEAHRRRAIGQPVNPPIWHLREQLAQLHDQYDLLVSDLDRRRI